MDSEDKWACPKYSHVKLEEQDTSEHAQPIKMQKSDKRETREAHKCYKPSIKLAVRKHTHSIWRLDAVAAIKHLSGGLNSTMT